MKYKLNGSKEISPEYSLEGLILKLKLQYFDHLIQRANSFERPWGWERLRAGGEGNDKGWDGWTASPTQWTWVWVNSGSWWWTGRPSVVRFMGSQRVGHDWATELNTFKRVCFPHYVHFFEQIFFFTTFQNDIQQLTVLPPPSVAPLFWRSGAQVWFLHRSRAKALTLRAA